MASKSAGQWIGSIVGAVIGVATGGTGYLALGAAIGGAVGGIIDPPKGPKIEGPRLSDLNVQTSSYGNPIPRTYGTVAMAGNVFWIENNKLTEHEKTEEQGGKGGGGATSTSWWYSVTFALGLCEGEISGIRRIWCSGKLIYDAGSDDTNTIIASNLAYMAADKLLSWTLYTGTETQTANPRIEATLGVGNVPGYRGLAYIVFEDFDLTDYGNSLLGAQFKVEVATEAGFDFIYSTVNSIPEDYSTGRTLVSAVMTPASVDYVAVTFDAGTGTTQSIETYRAEYGVVQRLIGKADIDFVPPISSNPGTLFVSQSDRPVAIFSHGNEPGDITHIGIVGIETSGTEFIRTYDPISVVSPNMLCCAIEGSTAWVVGGGTKITRYDGNFVSVQTDSTYGVRSLGYSSSCLFAIKSEQNGSTTTVYRFDKLSLALIDTYVQSVPSRYSPLFVVSDDEFYTVSSDVLYRWIDGVATSLGALYTGYAAGSTRNHWFVATPSVSVNLQELGTGPGDEAVLMASTAMTETAVELADIIEAECIKSGLLDAADIDVTEITQDVRGYRVTQVAAIRAGLEPLQGAWPFDIIQNGYTVKFIPRGGASVGTVTADELGAAAPGEKDVIRITEAREQDSQLARRAVLTYLDAAREYDVSEQSAERLHTDSVNVRTIEIPVVLTADEAAQMVERLLYLWWLERRDLSFTLPPTWAHLQPADVVTVQTGSATLEVRIVQCQYLPDGRVEISAKYNDAPVYVSTAVGASPPYTGQTLGVPGSSLMSLLDIPCVDSSYMDTPGLLAGVSGYVSAWTGGVLFRSSDGGQTYQSLQSFTAPGVAAGYATNALAAGATHIIDAANSVNIRMLSGTIESASLASVLSGANHFAFGVHGRWEIIAALTATEESDGSITLTNLLRGRFGTEQYGATHAQYDQIVALDSSKLRMIGMSSAELNVSRLWRAVTAGSNLDSAEDTALAYSGTNLKPLSPVYLCGHRDMISRDWSLSWVRRSRTATEPFSGIASPIGESTESYEVEIWDSTYSSLKRTLTGLTSASASYTSAQQISDFGSNQHTIYAKVYQLSANVGRGYPLISSTSHPISFADNYDDEILALSPIIYYKLDGNTTTVTDSSASANHGTAASTGVTYQQSPLIDMVGYSMLFAAGTARGYITVPRIASMDGDHTIVFLIKPSSFASSPYMLHKGDAGVGGQQGWMYLFNTDGTLQAAYFNSTWRSTSSTNVVASENEKVHLALVYDGSTSIKIYKNSALLETLTLAAAFVNNTTAAVINSKRTGGGYTLATGAYYDEFAWFDYQLTAEQITTLYEAT